MTKAELERALAPLYAVDAELVAEGENFLSLAPGRPRATPLSEIGRALCDEAHPSLVAIFADAFAKAVRAMREHFPQNLLWDLDALAASVWRDAERAPDPRVHLLEARDLLVSLHELFGSRGAVRFRYVHDFVYGFDWAKWVRRSPSDREGIGPFDLRFLRAMLDRGEELLALIASDDAKYPRLRDERPRNPFGFSREPEDELALMLDLARESLVPLDAWSLDPSPSWDKPYADLRRARAAALGLCKS